MPTRSEHHDLTTGQTSNAEVATAGINVPAADEVPLRVVELHPASGNMRNNILAVRCLYNATHVAGRPFKRIGESDNARRTQSRCEKASSANHKKESSYRYQPIDAASPFKLAYYSEPS